MPEISLEHLDRQLQLVLSELRQLRAIISPPKPAIQLRAPAPPTVTEPVRPTPASPGHKRYVSLKYFAVEMLGFKSSVSYYNHMHEPGWPQRIWITPRRPMLDYEECLAFQKARYGSAPVEPLERQHLPKPPRKRRTGRPVKPPHPRA